MGRKKTADGGGGDRHLNRGMSIRPTAQVRAAVEELARKERRRPTQMILILLEDALAARGLLPAEGDQGGTDRQAKPSPEKKGGGK